MLRPSLRLIAAAVALAALLVSACGSDSKSTKATDSTQPQPQANSAAQTFPAGSIAIPQGPVYQLQPSDSQTAIGFRPNSAYPEGLIAGGTDVKELRGASKPIGLNIDFPYRVETFKPDTMWIKKGATVRIGDPRAAFGGTYTATEDSPFNQGSDGNRTRLVGTLKATPKDLHIELVIRRLICPDKVHTASQCHT
jgi:hypothetical protein